MRQALEHNGDLLAKEEPGEHLILGAPALLGIFVAVAVVCAICFGFGYSRGHGWSAPGPAAEKAARPDPKPLGGTVVTEKPAPGVGITSPEASEAGEIASMPPRRASSSIPSAAPARQVSAPAGGPLVQAAPAANLMVQIAAVSRSADAETLAGALRRDGFAAMVRTSTGDGYFHVQVGPFATLAAARAMRGRLADSGYNAFVKP